MIKNLLRTGLFVVLPTLLLCVVMLEVGLRATGRRPSNVTEGIFDWSGTTYRLHRDWTKLSKTPSFSYTVHSNSYGLRDRAPGPRLLGPAPYYLFAGDSITFGNGVDYDDSFVGVFAQSARKRGIDAVNLAVGGHRFSDQEALLLDLMSEVRQKPAKVVVVFTKQFLTGFEADVSTTHMVKDGYLFLKDHWVVPYLLGKLGDASAAYSFFRDAIRKLQGRITQSGNRVALEALRDFSSESPWASRPLVDRFEGRLTKLDQEIRQAGATPVYVYMPVSLDLRLDEFLAMTGRSAADHDFLRFYKLLRRHADSAGIQLVDLLPPLQKLHAAGVAVSFMQDPHYTAEANRVIGQALADALLGAPASPPSSER